MSRVGVACLALLCLALPARAADVMTLSDRALWIGVGGGAVTLVGSGMWLASVRYLEDAQARGDLVDETRARHLGVIGGSVAFTGLCALGMAAVMSSWHEPPVRVSFEVRPTGAWAVFVGGTF